MKKGVLLILVALLIDGLQAGISLGLMSLTGVIAATAPIAGIGIGATVGLVLGGLVVGGVCVLTAGAGCVLVALGGAVAGAGTGATVGGVVGSATGVIAVPTGIALGFVINMCLSVVFGSFLIILMLIFLKKVYWKKLFFGLGELMPGLNNIPFWTAFVVLSLLKKSAEEGKSAFAGAAMLATTVMSPGGALGKAAGGIMRAKEKTTEIADRSKAFTSPALPGPMRDIKRQQDDLGDWIHREEINPAGTPKERVPAQATRNIFNDIRPIRTAAAILLAFMLAGAGLQVAYAQAVDPIRFVTSPEVPGPSQQVSIEAQGVGTFLGDATVTWQQDGKAVLSGMGERKFTFTVGSLGTVTRIHVEIQSPTNGTIVRDFTFIPTVVHLLWEADTSTPPMYRGKALYSAGSSIKVIALPQVVSNGTTISFNNLSFQWSVGDEPVVEQSGKGRSTITFEGSQLRASETVSVDVYLGAAIVGRARMTVPAVDPELSLYIKDPLRGVLYDQALPSSVSLLNTEITLQAEPYYFAKESITSGAASYTWTLGGVPTAGPDSARGVLTLRQTGEGGGEGQLLVSLQNTDPTKFIQAARAALHILFGNNSASGGASSFGL